METTSLTGGFSNEATQAAISFRAIMEAMARPGSLHKLEGCTPPAPLFNATGSALLTLCDSDTPIFLADELNCADVRNWITFHTSAAIVEPENCTFAIGFWQDLLPLSRYPTGTAEYPDRSATLIVQTNDLSASGAQLQGPGIKYATALSLPDKAAFQANHALYPRGVDFMFTCNNMLAALPRSTEVR